MRPSALIALRLALCAVLPLVALQACGNGSRDTETELTNPLVPADPGPLADEPDLGTPGPYVLSSPVAGAEFVAFPTDDDVGLTGRLFRGKSGDPGVVLVHSSDSDMRDLIPLAVALAKRDITVLTIDLRGYGQSEGKRDPARYAKDIERSVEILGQFGVARAGLVGFEMGGTAAVAAASSEAKSGNDPIEALVTIGSAPSFENLDASGAARGLAVPSLIVSRQKDAGLAELIPKAATEVIGFEGRPEEDQRVIAAVTDFLARVL